MGSSLNWAVSFKKYFSPLTTMLFTMSETFKKSQLSEFFDVPSGCLVAAFGFLSQKFGWYQEPRNGALSFYKYRFSGWDTIR